MRNSLSFLKVFFLIMYILTINSFLKDRQFTVIRIVNRHYTRDKVKRAFKMKKKKITGIIQVQTEQIEESYRLLYVN